MERESALTTTPNDERKTIQSLPIELLRACLARLLPSNSLRDLLNASLVCRAWRALINDDAVLWKRACEVYFVPEEIFWRVRGELEEEEDDEENDEEGGDGGENPEEYRRAFKTFYGIYRDYLPVYLEQRPLYLHLRRFLHENSPDTLDWMRPGNRLPEPGDDPTSIDYPADHILGPTLVHDEMKAFRLWYSFFDGQKPTGFGMDRGVGLFGTYRAHGMRWSLNMLPSHKWELLSIDSAGILLLEFAREPFQPPRGTSLALVVRVDVEKLDHLLHQVIQFDESVRFVSRGKFTEFIRTYVEDLESGRFPVLPDGRISRFPERGLCTSHAESAGLEIHVSSIPMFDLDDRQHHSFRLRVAFTDTIKNEDVAQQQVGRTRKNRRVQIKDSRWSLEYRSGFLKEDVPHPVLSKLEESKLPVLHEDESVSAADSNSWGRSFEVVGDIVAREFPEPAARPGRRPYRSKLYDPCKKITGRVLLRIESSGSVPEDVWISLPTWVSLDYPCLMDGKHDKDEFEKWMLRAKSARDGIEVGGDEGEAVDEEEGDEDGDGQHDDEAAEDEAQDHDQE